MHKLIIICLALFTTNSLYADGDCDTCIYCGKLIKPGEKYMSRATYDTTKYNDEDYFDTEKIYYFHSKCGRKGESIGIYPHPLAISIRYGAKIGIAFDKIEKKTVNRSKSKSRSKHNRSSKKGKINKNQNKKALPFNTRGYTTREDINRVWFSDFNCYPKWKFVKALPKTNECVRYVYKCYIDKGTYNVVVITVGCKKGAIPGNTPVYIMLINVIQPDLKKGQKGTLYILNDLVMLFTGYGTPQVQQFVYGLTKTIEEVETELRDNLLGRKGLTVSTKFEEVVILPYRIGIITGERFKDIKDDNISISRSLSCNIYPITMGSIIDKLGFLYDDQEELKRRGF